MRVHTLVYQLDHCWEVEIIMVTLCKHMQVHLLVSLLYRYVVSENGGVATCW